MNPIVNLIGAAAFGAVIGWSASLAIRGQSTFGLAQLSALIATVAGGAVAAVWNTPELFSAYSIGLACFFFLQRFVGHQSVAAALDEAVTNSR